ncbi:MAG: autorepressor SdpR family transcription factor [Clostridiales bacterium]|nr:autorepressor SdpR family transcription factor [Clostridiales bacterium]MCF8022996.1 autorepressor SdpR family transcription factor [Clostridiales bacterium]
MFDSIFKALSDPTRRKILNLLRQEDVTAGEIAEQFDISKPSMSHHLSILKHAGLVLDEKKGQFIYYSLNTTVFQDLMAWFNDFLDFKRKGEDDDRSGK